MKEIQAYDSKSEIAEELEIAIEEVDSYFKNYYINRFFPIRDLTPIELALAKYYEELRYTTANELMSMCVKHNVAYMTYLTDRWLLPKAILFMEDKHYFLLKKYMRIILEPYLHYKNFRAPRLQLLTKDEIAMLLSNIATGTSIIPGDQVTIRTSMEAMDRLVDLYDAVNENRSAVDRDELKPLSAAKLVQLIAAIQAEEVKGQTIVTIKPKSKKKKQEKKGD